MVCQRQSGGENRGELNEDGERPRSIADDIGGQLAVKTPSALSPAFRRMSFLPQRGEAARLLSRFAALGDR